MKDRRLLDGIEDSVVQEALDIVNHKAFWTQGANALKLLAPITKCMGDFEKDSCCLASVYEGFLWLKHHKVYNKRVKGVRLHTQKRILELLEERWRFLHTDSMGIAYLLDHTKKFSAFQGDDQINTVTQLVGIAERFYPPEKITKHRDEI
ncbi:hypothetical protein PHMEG_00034754 [Phytophthora megakarya]|uniref:Uncharacterized protein n=1 Tax=Phytophthora megakarya TaxID=4795 RepID=A0A225UQP3_9STRA|nr:hypothetical protein PHMEG_00034754 [Phytophthora megakarya]